MGKFSAACHDHVQRDRLVVAGPPPDADALAAVLDGGVHRQPLRSQFTDLILIDVFPGFEMRLGHIHRTF